MNKKIVLIALILSLFSLKSMATIWYVDSANTSGFQDGGSWTGAFTNPQNGINAANAGDSIWIAKGTYIPASGQAYVMKQGVKMFGGFLNTYTSFSQRNFTANKTILKGNGGTIIDNSTNSLTTASVLDGFTITATGYSNGMYHVSSSPTIRNCIFKDITTNGDGAAMFNVSSSPVISNCTFSNNISLNTSGAIYNAGGSPVISNCSFTGNRSESRGGAVRNRGWGAAPIISNTTFTANIANYGGAVDNSEDASMTLNNCIFNGDTCRSLGAGIYNNSVTISVKGCTFSNNVCMSDGGFTSVTALSGAGMYNQNSSISIDSSTFTNNRCDDIYNPASTSGIAIFNWNCYGAISNSNFSGNVGLSNGSNSEGAAIVNSAYSVIQVDSCVFTNNLSYGVLGSRGGAVCDYSATTFTQCSFTNNQSITGNSFAGGYVYGGGAICTGIASSADQSKIIQCNFTGNQTLTYGNGGANGGAITNLKNMTLISGCTFNGNRSVYGIGGAIYNAFDATTTPVGSIKNSTFTGNSAPLTFGGAIFNDGIGDNYKISNCSFRADSAFAGGAVYNISSSPVIANCLFSKNIADTLGAAVCNEVNASPVMVNCTIIRNKATHGGSGICNITNSTPKISNTIMWGNFSGVFNDGSSLSNTKYSLIQGFPASTTSHLIAGTTNPLFVDTSGLGNYMLQAASPCINMGSNDSIPSGISTDLANNARIAGGTVDMGVYEYGSFPPPALNLGNDTSICAGSSLVLNAQITGASYAWNTGATTQTITVNTTGTYFVTVNNSGNIVSDTINVTVSPLPVVNLGNDTTFCGGNTLTLNAQNAGSTYLWNNGSTSQTIGVNTSGTYSVKVTNAGQCVKRDTIMVVVNPAPVVNLGNDTVICAGNSLTLNAQNAGSTYLWNNGGTNQTLAVNASGTYSVKVTNASQCVKNDTIQVTVSPLPVVNLGNDTTFCGGNTLTLNAQNVGSTYLWNNGSTSQTIGVNTSGTYSVKVTNAGQCVKRDTIMVVVNPAPVVNLGNDTVICAGNSLTLNAQNAGSTYLWNNGSTNQTLAVNASGTYSVKVTNASQCIKNDTINVTVSPLPVVSLGNDTTFCGGNTLTLNAQNAGSTYLWNNGATSQTIGVNTSGTYSVKVTNAGQCVKRDTIMVVVNPAPVVNLGNDTVICAGNSLTLNAQNAGSTYLWNNGSTNQTLAVNASGTYSVKVTNASQCVKNDTINVTVSPLPVVNLGNDTTFCGGNTLTLNAQNAGSSYLWNNGSTSQTIGVNTSGTYSVKVTNAGQCVKRDTIMVVVNPAPVVNLGNDTVICAGNSLTLNAQNAGSTYLWNNGSTNQTLAVNASGTYSVKVTNASQCVKNDTIQVTVSPLPVVNLGNDTTFCGGNTLTLNAQNAGSTYLWNNNSTAQTQNVTTTGTYYVMVTNANLCKGTDTIQVSINPSPIVDLGGDIAFCFGSTLTLNAQNAGAAYLWNNGATTQTIDVSSGGAYAVTVTNTNQCIGKDTINIIVFPSFIVDLGNDTAFCSGNTLSLNAQNPGNSYVWSTGSVSQNINVNTTGNYYVTVTDAGNCKGSDTIQVTVNPLPVVNLGNDITIANGASTTLDAGNPGSTYLWSTGATTQTINVSTTGTYSVTVTNSNGCQGNDAITVTVGPVGIRDVNKENYTLTVTPNPATEIVTIHISDLSLLKTKAILTDAYGRVIREVIMQDKSQQLSLSGLAQGVYILRMQNGQAVRIVKE